MTSLPVLSADPRTSTCTISTCTAAISPPSPSTEPAAKLAAASFAGTETFPEGLMIGLDVGSTTVKAVVVEPLSDRILWQDYQRHETRQAEKALELLEAVEAAFPRVPARCWRLFLTGSGGGALVRHLGGKFVQEVNAVALAVEKLFPEVESVVELGGQDAKIIVFKEIESGGRKKKVPSMNDKCAGGTGAVIDKVSAKLGIAAQELGRMGYEGLKLHPVAGKCGVFAETDVNSLQKQGVPADELMASLFESIIQQNLSVLTRGNTLQPTVLLLGGPNTYIRGMRECWRRNIPLMWEQRRVDLGEAAQSPGELIVTPDNAHLFAALGAVELGKAEATDDPQVGLYAGRRGLADYLDHGRAAEKAAEGSRALWISRGELREFKEKYRKKPWAPAVVRSGRLVEAVLGIDGGSTSTKGVLLAPDKSVLAKAYLLSEGNPIEDTREIIGRLERHVTASGARLEVLGVGTTGYAKDTLRDVLAADVALVETVAHTEACLHYYPGTDVIVDVGGQDIKLIVLKQGRVKDFKLNTQCSAGNGYFLQATAKDFGFDVTDYAETAFSAEAMPEFGYGCAVFLQSDIVDFQRRGWRANEIMAGLAAVLPKNIWLYVAQIPNLANLGSKFVLQGGTQHNLAAVKSQVDFIRSRFRGNGTAPEVLVHRHCGESGAIGSAIEAHRLWQKGRKSEFIGLDRVREIRYKTTRDEDTRCYFCKNNCLRTFIDVNTGFEKSGQKSSGRENSGHQNNGRENSGHQNNGRKLFESKVALAAGHQRLIIATCEKGTVEDVDAMRQIKSGLDATRKQNPNFVVIASKSVFREPRVDDVADRLPTLHLGNLFRSREIERRRAAMDNRRNLRIGFPRVLNMYAQAPFFLGFFTSLGLGFRQLVFSDYTSPELYKRGARRGAIDPCFPSKLGIPHVHDLLHRVHRKKPLTHIFFPMVDTFPTSLHGVDASRACPTVVATPDATHAAFVKEGDLFAEAGIVFKKTMLNLDQPALCARQMYADWKDEIGLGLEESLRAVEQGLAALRTQGKTLRHRARQVLDQLEREKRLGIVVLARPYHNDPGANHGILEALQKAGYPIFWQDALPLDDDLLDRLFGEEVRAGVIDHPRAIDDVWKNTYSENTDRKVWAAKFTARHPNLVALELSSFKCGHDAPVYTVIEEIVESSGTPYFCFKDIDENNPSGSIKIRIETIEYFLTRYRERVLGS